MRGRRPRTALGRGRRPRPSSLGLCQGRSPARVALAALKVPETPKGLRLGQVEAGGRGRPRVEAGGRGQQALAFAKAEGRPSLRSKAEGQPSLRSKAAEGLAYAARPPKAEGRRRPKATEGRRPPKAEGRRRPKAAKG
jgi:hypothetical protein